MDKKEMPNFPPEKKEYDLEVGISRAIEKIEKLLEKKQYVVVEIVGSGSNVGTTHVGSLLEKILQENGVSIDGTSDINNLGGGVTFTNTDGPRVFFLRASTPPYTKAFVLAKDDQLKEKAEKFNLPFSKIDLRVLVYRPDKPFRDIDHGLADIIIRNEGALDKKL